MAIHENYIFTGFGHALGEYLITNKVLEQAIETDYLTRFNKNRIQTSKSFAKALEQDSNLTPFKFMAELKMGFENRNHVVPFPPNKAKYKYAKTALDLAVEAVNHAFSNSDIDPEIIDAWLVSTATPNERAPGLGETLKAYFVNFENQAETMTLASACGGFNYNLERGINYLKTHPEANHLIVCHTEVMSELLVDTSEFVPYVTFADGAAAVILSRVKSEQKEGIVSIVNYQDNQMINFLGASDKGRMYMQPNIIKNRATVNLIRNSKEVLKQLNWNLEDIDLVIPHQTGNAIVHGVVESLGIDFSKVYQDVQYEHGNLSGASIPACMSILSEDNKLIEGQRILTATAGLGGENGAFVYIVPKKTISNRLTLSLKGKTCLITGASGGIGEAVAVESAKRGADLILHYGSNIKKAKQLKQDIEKQFEVKVRLFSADFSEQESTNKFILDINKLNININYLVHTAAITGSLSRATEVPLSEFEQVMRVNYISPIEITKQLFSNIKNTILYVGSVAEDAEFPGSIAYVAAKRALHGFAASFAQEALKNSVRSVYYMPGMVAGGMAKYLDKNQIQASLLAIDQKEATSLELIANRIVNSLYIPKVLGANSTYEGVLTVRRDAYYTDEIHYHID